MKDYKSILSACSLSKKFGDIVAVDNISFEIYKGEIFGFLGPNGAGKTTTIKMMSGLLEPDSGSVTIHSEDHGRSTGICPQHLVVWENLTCLEQVLYMGRMYNIRSQEVRKRADELLGSLELTGVKERLAKSLSGGMQRRLNIALALIHSPEIVFLDEPQAGLDPQSRVLVRDYIKSIKHRTTVVLTTHDMEEAEKLSDRICIIDKGKLLVTGSANDILSANGEEDLVEIDFVGDVKNEFLHCFGEDLITGVALAGNKISFKTRNPQSSLENILKAIREQGLEVKGLQLRKKSLEDIFIGLTGRSIRE
jgi:ABC-2 type transport system ATP-binding protein